MSADDGPRKLELVHLASQTAIRETVSCQEPQNVEKPQKILKIRTYGNNRRTASTISGSGGTGGCVRSFCNRERSETPVHHREKWQKPRKCQKRSKPIPFSFTNSHFVEMSGTGYRKCSNPQKLHICAVSLKKPEVQTPSRSRKTLWCNAAVHLFRSGNPIHFSCTVFTGLASSETLF